MRRERAAVHGIMSGGLCATGHSHYVEGYLVSCSGDQCAPGWCARRLSHVSSSARARELAVDTGHSGQPMVSREVLLMVCMVDVRYERARASMSVLYYSARSEEGHLS